MLRKNYRGIEFSVDPRFEPLHRLGRGTFGDVYQFSTNSGPSSNLVAIKRIKEVFESEVHLLRAVRELKLLNHFAGSPYIVDLLDADLVTDEPYRGLYCHMELLDTDLATIIRNGQEVLTEWHLMAMSFQLMCALKYIHSANVIHRDLKPGNILVFRSGRLKICDFGLARAMIGNDYDRERYTGYVTTRWYRAPEILLKVDRYHYGLDMWAAGTIIAEIVLRKPLFRGDSSNDQLAKIISVIGSPPLQWFEDLAMREFWFKSGLSRKAATIPHVPLSQIIAREFSEPLYDLLTSLLVFVPDDRLTAVQSLKHRFFDKLDGFDVPQDCSPIDPAFELVHPSLLFDYLAQEVHKVRASRRF